jgi:Polyketide cyclase / dehydrase and lipid transport
VKTGNKVAATFKTDVASSVEEVFDFVAAEDVLPKVLTGYGLLPAVVRTSGNTGPWDKPGSSRTVHLADKTTSREEVTDYDRPRYFAYRTSDYTFALKYLATSAEGQWWFEERQGQTHVRWTYTFAARGPLTSILLLLFVKSQWSGYMRVCLENTRSHFTATTLHPPAHREASLRAALS